MYVHGDDAVRAPHLHEPSMVEAHLGLREADGLLVGGVHRDEGRQPAGDGQTHRQ